MRFKIKNTDVKISFSFFAVFLLSLVSDTFNIYLFSFIASLIHEFVHVVFILLFGAKISTFSLTLFGGNIKRSTPESVLLNDYFFESAVLSSRRFTTI